MSQAQSPSTGPKYGRARVLAVWGQSRSTFYARQQRARQPVAPQRRGPKTKYINAGLMERIRAILAASPVHGEGHRKIWARLRVQDVKPRVLLLMRQNRLLAPQRQLAPVAEKPHAGSIVADEPNQMWGTDATATVTLADGQVTVFAAVDHCTADCVGIHAIKRARGQWLHRTLLPHPSKNSFSGCGTSKTSKSCNSRCATSALATTASGSSKG